MWVVGDPGRIDAITRELSQSRFMISRYGGRRDSLPREKQRLLIEEQSRDGHWRPGYSEPVQTSFAILFLKKATAPISSR